MEDQWSRGHFVCVGLDSAFDRIPDAAHRYRNGVEVSVIQTIVAFNQAIVEATYDLVCAYKLNPAFYEPYGAGGIDALRRSIEHIHMLAPDVPVIFDGKRGDIGESNVRYAYTAFRFLRADAVTVHPYLGVGSLHPFLDYVEKGIIVLCRTSNPASGEFQDMFVNGEPLYCCVARRVASSWNRHGNCAVAVGGTFPHALRSVRRIVGDMPILIPGAGAQGGIVGEIVQAGKDSRGRGVVINSSRGVIFASGGADFAGAARCEAEKLHMLISQYR